MPRINRELLDYDVNCDEIKNDYTTEAITTAVTEAITNTTTEAITTAVTEAIANTTTEAITTAVTEAIANTTTEAITTAVTEAIANTTTEAITTAITEATIYDYSIQDNTTEINNAFNSYYAEIASGIFITMCALGILYHQVGPRITKWCSSHGASPGKSFYDMESQPGVVNQIAGQNSDPGHEGDHPPQ